jgi:hypothetical protein
VADSLLLQDELSPFSPEKIEALDKKKQNEDKNDIVFPA